MAAVNTIVMVPPAGTVNVPHLGPASPTVGSVDASRTVPLATTTDEVDR